MLCLLELQTQSTHHTTCLLNTALLDKWSTPQGVDTAELTAILTDSSCELALQAAHEAAFPEVCQEWQTVCLKCWKLLQIEILLCSSKQPTMLENYYWPSLHVLYGCLAKQSGFGQHRMRALTGRNLALVSRKALVLDPGRCCSGQRAVLHRTHRSSSGLYSVFHALEEFVAEMMWRMCWNSMLSGFAGIFSVNWYRSLVVESIVFSNWMSSREISSELHDLLLLPVLDVKDATYCIQCKQTSTT